MTKEVNLDNPDSWPDDVEELSKLVDGVGGEPAAEDEASTESDETDESKAADEATKKAEQDALDAKAEDDKGKETEDKSSEAEAGEKETPAEDKTEMIDGIPVLTRDGKKAIPFEVLKQTRTRAQDAETRVQELEAVIAELDAEPAKEPTTSEPTTTEPEANVKLDSMIGKIKDEWGDDIANVLTEVASNKGGGNAGLSAVIEKLDALEARLDSRDTAEYDTESGAVEAAIEGNPLMMLWLEDRQNSAWYQRSVEVSELLLKSDADYASKSWAERFDILVEKVEALHGKSPHRLLVDKANTATKEEPAPGKEVSKEETESKAREAAEKAETKPPTSLSEIKGGEADESTETEALEKLSDTDMMAKLEKLADDPDKLRQFLQEVA